MRDVVENPPKEQVDRAPDVPDAVTHVIAARADAAFTAPAPEDYGGEGERIVYEHGDELPLEQGRECLQAHPATLAGIDDSGEVLFGGECDADARFEAVRKWQSGETFDANAL